MRKRVSRPRRFAAVENTAIDALPSVLATGLLTKLIRAKDGDEVTVEALCKTHIEGRESLTKAMRMLVDKAFVVKFKVQRAASEVVEEDGQLVAKRGGSWYTTFTVDSIEFTVEDVAAMLAEIYDAGNVKSHRIEPEFLDPKKNGSDWGRPTTGEPSVGAACEDAEAWPEDDPRPTYGSPTAGPPTVGHSAAHIRKKTVLTETEREDGDAPSGRSPAYGRRPSSGSKSGPVDKGGCAASGKTSPSPTQHAETRRPAGPKKSRSKKAAHTPQQLHQVRRVRALFPRELLDAEGGLPDVPTLSDAILTAMGEGRTVEQMGDRIWYRWSNHGFADTWAEAGRFEKPVGVAVALVRPLRRGDRFACPDLRCENGADIDTKVPCRLCEVRIADWKAERARARGQKAAEGPNGASVGAGSSGAVLPPQRPVQARVLLKDCGNGLCSASIPAAGGPLCRDCAAAAGHQNLENAGAPAPF